MASKSKKAIKEALTKIFEKSGEFEQIQTDDKYFGRIDKWQTFLSLQEHILASF